MHGASPDASIADGASSADAAEAVTTDVPTHETGPVHVSIAPELPGHVTPPDPSPSASSSDPREVAADTVRVLRTAVPAMRRCYDRATARGATTSTALSLELSIDPHGHVTHAVAHVGDAALATCMERALVGLRFSPHASGLLTITYPLNF